MTTINVNLKPCSCSAGRLNAARRCGTPSPVDPLPCDDDCPGKPILIPCPIPPRVEFKVVLGECIDAGRRPVSPIPRACAPDGRGHHVRCPARPISVSCSISGKT
jgi:hypothetical protein